MEGLDEVVVGAGPEAPDLLLHLALGGEHDDRGVPRALLGPDPARHLVAVELGQHHVEQQQVGVLEAPQPHGLGPVGRGQDLVALLAQGIGEQALDVGIVVDDEDLGGHAGLGGGGLGASVSDKVCRRRWR